MPNCSFYALRDDAAALLDFVLAKTPCEVYESYSEPGTELRRFHAVDELLRAYRVRAHGSSLLLSLYAPQMGGALAVRRIDLDRTLFTETPWRSHVVGWGLIQLDLQDLHAGRLPPSNTNHSSEKRALSYGSAVLGDPSDWRWAEVVRLSRRINRFIHRIAADKSGSRPVLPAAAAAVNSGAAQLAANL